VPERDFIVLGRVVGIQVLALIRYAGMYVAAYPPLAARQEAARGGQERNDGAHADARNVTFWMSSYEAVAVQVAVKIEQKRNCQNYV
jgi:hypothetical protein